MTTSQAYFQAWASSLPPFELAAEISRRVVALEHIAADRSEAPPLGKSIAEGIRAGVDAALDELCERCQR